MLKQPLCFPGAPTYPVSPLQMPGQANPGIGRFLLFCLEGEHSAMQLQVTVHSLCLSSLWINLDQTRCVDSPQTRKGFGAKKKILSIFGFFDFFFFTFLRDVEALILSPDRL